jgi:DNA polymerase V
MGDPWHLCRDRFKGAGLIVRSSNYTLYGDMSARVMGTLARFTPDLEIYSIDEAFLSFAGFETRLEAHARELRRTVQQWTGIPVSVGIAPTKTLAKVANRFAKKDLDRGGVCLLLNEADQREALGRLELTDLWGIAGRLAQRLKALGITTPLALRDADPRFVRGHCSVVLERMVYELRGTPCLGLEQMTPDRKSIMASRSFGRAVEAQHELNESVAVYVARAAERMRRQRLATANLIVFVETNRFKPADPQHSGSKAAQLPVATADTGKLIQAAMAALDRLYRPGFRYKMAGVILLDLVPASRVQASLFDAPDDARSIARMKALDALNARFGRGTVAYGTAGERQAWGLRREFISPRYTTEWSELLRVSA